MLRARSLVTLVATGALVIGMAGPALAEGNGVPVNAFNQMRFEHPDTNSISWQAVAADSPLDTNSRALVIHLDPLGFADAYTKHSLAINTPATSFKNLSFEFDNTKAFQGGLRFSVIMADGSVLFAPADACNNPETVRPTWSRADFTGGLTNCTLFYGAETFSADGVNSAWANFAAAHPEQVVHEDFIINDAPAAPNGPTSVVDRIAFGTNLLYGYSATRAVPCHNDENAC